MIDLIYQEVGSIAGANRENLHKHFDRMKDAYEKALTAKEDELVDQTFYTPD